ncbi:MAG: hypothetical protein FD143_3393, partial [Ignavibacteria bacterium]
MQNCPYFQKISITEVRVVENFRHILIVLTKTLARTT